MGRPDGRKDSRTSNAVKILYKRYVGEDTERKVSIQEERNNTQKRKWPESGPHTTVW